jgi:hypothetical protein
MKDGFYIQSSKSSILYGRSSLQRTWVTGIDTIQEIGDAQAADGATTSHRKNRGKKGFKT